MTDKRYIIYSLLFIDGVEQGYLAFDGTNWTLDEELLRQDLCKITDAGANGIRFGIGSYNVWTKGRVEKFGKKGVFTPWLYDEAKKAWDLDTENPQYWAIMREAAEICDDPTGTGSAHLRIWDFAIDHCEMKPGWWNANSPWLHNVQGINPFDPAGWPFVAAHFRKTVSVLDGLDIAHLLMNESSDPRTPELAEHCLFPIIKELGLPIDRIGTGCSMPDYDYLGEGKYVDKPNTVQDFVRARFGSYFGDENQHLIYREVHGIGNLMPGDKYRPYGDRIAQALCWWSKDQQSELRLLGPVIWDTDGQKKGDSKCDVEKGTDPRPSAETMGKIALLAWCDAGVNNVHIAHCPQTVDHDCLARTFEAISTSYKTVFGVWPENHGKAPYNPPVEYVDVLVCTASGLIPNSYCPEKVIRKFIKGTEPVTICAVHKKPDCKCSYWLTEPKRPDIWRWLKCILGLGQKRCK